MAAVVAETVAEWLGEYFFRTLGSYSAVSVHRVLLYVAITLGAVRLFGYPVWRALRLVAAAVLLHWYSRRRSQNTIHNP